MSLAFAWHYLGIGIDEGRRGRIRVVEDVVEIRNAYGSGNEARKHP